MSNPIKSIALGVRKVFKQVFTPKGAKGVLIGAAIFAAGSALGVWGAGSASAGGSATAAGRGPGGIPNVY